jgi:TolA-binding protein
MAQLLKEQNTDPITYLTGKYRESPRTLHIAGMVYQAQDNMKDALTIYERILANYPESEEAKYALEKSADIEVKLYEGLLDIIQQKEKLLNKEDTAARKLASEIVTSALAKYEKAAKGMAPDSTNAPRMLEKIANVYKKRGETEKLVETYKRIAADYRENEEVAIAALEEVAKVGQETKRVGEMIDAYRKIVEGYPKNPAAISAQEKIVSVYANEWKAYENAVEECRKMAEKFPGTEEAIHAQYLIGQLYYTDKQYDKALTEFQRFVDNYSKSADVQSAYLHIALAHIGKKDWNNAVNVLRKMIKEDFQHPLSARAQFLLGYCHLTQQKYDQAKVEYQRVLDNYPNSEYVNQAKDFVERLSKISK